MKRYNDLITIDDNNDLTNWLIYWLTHYKSIITTYIFDEGLQCEKQTAKLQEKRNK